jgi:hypothetical protein
MSRARSGVPPREHRHHGLSLLHSINFKTDERGGKFALKLTELILLDGSGRRSVRLADRIDE